MKINNSERQVLVFKYKSEGLNLKQIKNRLEYLDQEQQLVYDMVKFHKKLK